MPGKYLSTKVGTIGGTLAASIPNVGTEDLLASGILAVFGACISFVVSLLLKIYFKNWLKKKLKLRKNRIHKKHSD